jgi:hypothetical protein
MIFLSNHQKNANAVSDIHKKAVQNSSCTEKDDPSSSGLDI